MNARRTLVACLAMFALTASNASAAALCRPLVGPTEVVATGAERHAAGNIAQPPLTDHADGFAWPDTPLGVVRSGSSYEFFGSDGGLHSPQRYRGRLYGNGKYGSATRTVGTLDDPLGISPKVDRSVPPIDVSIEPNPDSNVNPDYARYDYMGGGPVYRVPPGHPGAGDLLMVYHGEIPTPGTQSFYSVLALAVSADEGRSWTDLGEIVRINQPYLQYMDGFDIGDPPLVDSLDGKYLYIYFRDWIANGTPHWENSLTDVSVARVGLDTLLAAAFGSPKRHAAAFTKYYAGAWDQPGLGGLSSDLNPNAAYAGESQVAYDDALHAYLMVVDAGVLTALSQSSDGITWSPPVLLRDYRNLPDRPTGYGAPVGLGADPRILGWSFYVYRTRYPTTGGGWKAATVERFLVTCR